MNGIYNGTTLPRNDRKMTNVGQNIQCITFCQNSLHYLHYFELLSNRNFTTRKELVSVCSYVCLCKSLNCEIMDSFRISHFRNIGGKSG